METGQKTIQTIKKNVLNLYKELSIQVSLSGLSFCILDTASDTIIAYKHIDFGKKISPSQLLDKVKHLFNTYNTLKGNFKAVHVIHDNELSTLVPEPLFDEDHIADYLKFNSRILPTDYITHDEITSQELVNIYVPYVNINNFLIDTFGSFEFKHFSTVLLENILVPKIHTDTKKMYVHVCKEHFEVIVTDANKLQLYNSFEYHTKEDFIYYILFVAEQLKLNPELFELVFLGQVSLEDELYNMVYKYVRHVSFYETQLSYKLGPSFEDDLATNFILLNSFK